MSKNSAIEIILRVRPHKNPYKGFKLKSDSNKLEFFTAKSQEEGYVNNKEQLRVYDFNEVFDMNAQQERIFDKVGKEVVDSAIQGYNGTIFAYGQTGSGKTFTMTGGSQSYEDRGLIPRTLSYIFSQSQRSEVEIKVFISYMQIYKSTGYDLLDPDNVSKKIEDLPKVEPREGANGEMILRNLRVLPITSEEDALNWLLIGDTNRVVKKTPKNDQSTRSHCLFIIRLEIKKPGSDVKTTASIHLVDLSGSQRIKQTNVEGDLQKEAISINLGLFNLQRVIVCLNKKSKGQNIYIPYRDSLMTMVLQDSIGGNCKTRMIATISAKQQDIPQSISTCKFAQRVALIKNQVQRNEQVDPGIIITRLKKENQQLKAELALLRGEEIKDQLDKYDVEDCHKIVEQYITNQDPSAAIILADRLKINECFYHFKYLLKKGGTTLNSSHQNKTQFFAQNKSIKVEEDNTRVSQEVKRLKLLVQQRDNEIALLLSLIKKKGGEPRQITMPVSRKQEEQNFMKSIIIDKPMVFKEEEQIHKVSQKSKIKNTQALDESNRLAQKGFDNDMESTKMINASKLDQQQIEKMLIKPVNLTSEQLLDHALAFEQFRKAYRKYQAMQKNNTILQQKMTKGKQLGRTVNDARKKVNELKTKLQQLKRQNMLNNLVEGQEKDDPEQQAIRNEIMKLKQQYKQSYEQLKSIKHDIDTINVLEKKNVQQLQKDFQKWVLFTQKQRQNMLDKVDSSLMTSSIKDKEVNKHLESFFKARDQIRNK